MWAPGLPHGSQFGGDAQRKKEGQGTCVKGGGKGGKVGGRPEREARETRERATSGG